MFVWGEGGEGNEVKAGEGKSSVQGLREGGREAEREGRRVSSSPRP